MLFGYVIRHYDENEDPDFIGWQIISRVNLIGEHEVARSIGSYETCYQAQEACKAHAVSHDMKIKMHDPFTEDDPNGDKSGRVTDNRNAAL